MNLLKAVEYCIYLSAMALMLGKYALKYYCQFYAKKTKSGWCLRDTGVQLICYKSAVNLAACSIPQKCYSYRRNTHKHGRRKKCAGGLAAVDFENFSKKGCVLSFEWEKKISPLLALPLKNFGESPSAPTGNILLTSMRQGNLHSLYLHGARNVKRSCCEPSH